MTEYETAVECYSCHDGLRYRGMVYTTKPIVEVDGLPERDSLVASSGGFISHEAAEAWCMGWRRRDAERADRAVRSTTPEWVVNDLGELGVEICGEVYFLYKGKSIRYATNDGPAMYRPVEKREFGEVCKAPRMPDGTDRYTDGDGWAPLPLRSTLDRSTEISVHVRIAVAVDKYGNWNSAGFDGYNGDDAMIDATEPITDPRCYWLEVDLPRPAATVVTDVEITEADPPEE